MSFIWRITGSTAPWVVVLTAHGAVSEWVPSRVQTSLHVTTLSYNRSCGVVGTRVASRVSDIYAVVEFIAAKNLGEVLRIPAYARCTTITQSNFNLNVYWNPSTRSHINSQIFWLIWPWYWLISPTFPLIHRRHVGNLRWPPCQRVTRCAINKCPHNTNRLIAVTS